MSADELRRAAAKVRELAEAATPGPWVFNSSMEDDLHGDTAGWVGHDRTGDGFQEYVCGTSNHPDGFADGAYIAAMSPVVGLALADWLEHMAERGCRNIRPDLYLTGWTQAHAVARQILGEA